MAIGLLASIGRRNVEGVKQVGTVEDLPSLREETQSRFKPAAPKSPQKKRKCLVHSDRERLKSLPVDDLGLNVDI